MEAEKNDYVCRVCLQKSINPHSHKVSGVTRLIKNELYTVWSCQHCRSLNAYETVDYNYIYESYPIQKQADDFFSRHIFAKRLKMLKKIGFSKTHTLLDYGCGSGLFVRYLQDKGYKAEGYEPYNSQFNSPDFLLKKYDYVVSQDVIEHVDKPSDFLQQFKTITKAGSIIAIGTPFADHVDVFDLKDQVAALHQPYHRFLVSREQVPHLFKAPEWEIQDVIESYYIDTLFPFVNEQFLMSYFKSGGYVMDVGFEPINILKFFKYPELIITGLFGGFFPRKQNLLIVLKVIDRNDKGPLPNV